MDIIKLSDAEKVFIIHGVQENVRIDGRAASDFRPMELQTNVVSSSNGSARLRLANTDVLVSVKTEITEPLASEPNKGRLEFFVDCSANATPMFEGQGGEELGNLISASLDDAYCEDCLDLGLFSIIPRRQCWLIYVDILILEYGGNLLDTVSIAVKAALHSTQIPNISVTTTDGGSEELEISDDPLDFWRIDVTKAPIIITVSQIGTSHIVDACSEEEACRSSSMRLSVNNLGFITSMVLSGGGSLAPDTVLDMLDTGVRTGQSLDKILNQRLLEEENIANTQSDLMF